MPRSRHFRKFQNKPFSQLSDLVDLKNGFPVLILANSLVNKSVKTFHSLNR